MVRGITPQHVVEHACVVEVLGNRDAQREVARVSTRTRNDLLQREARPTDHDGHQDGYRQVAHAGNESHRHGEKDVRDVSSGARCAPEAHEAEGPCHGHACPKVPVDHRDHHADDCRKHHQRDGERAGVALPEGVDGSEGGAKDERHRNAGEKGKQLDAGSRGGCGREERVSHGDLLVLWAKGKGWRVMGQRPDATSRPSRVGSLPRAPVA